MKNTKQVIHIVKHKLTGAEVPVIVRKISKDNIIEDYSEFTEKRKGFTVEMLQNRWDKSRDDVLELLQTYQVPAYVSQIDVINIDKGKLPVDVAIFFEEYIYGIEKKEKLKHNKLKSRYLNNETEH